MNDRETRWRDLFARANGGDGVAYAAFLTEAAVVVRRIAMARSGGGRNGARNEDVEDIVQEVLIAVHAKRHTWRGDAPVSPWLYAIARYKTTDAFRRRGRPTEAIEDWEDVLADDAPGDPTAARDLAILMDGLDDRSARIVRAIGIDGDSAETVGRTMGMTEGAVRVAYHRAMTRLRERAGADD